ncbi:uncharacterized protein METZ01_LOCUS314468 [marine metagenome]|uniref:Uncharacterized protein n=1 Tax=marine metagenome TaxID=408172 RepID=A0A382NK90_9ZZZZ
MSVAATIGRVGGSPPGCYTEPVAWWLLMKQLKDLLVWWRRWLPSFGQMEKLSLSPVQLTGIPPAVGPSK